MADPNTETTTVYGFGAGGPAQIGNSGGTVGFYGETPVAQQATSLGAAVATTVAVSTTTLAVTSWGYASSTQANNLTVQVSDIYTALVAIGILSA